MSVCTARSVQVVGGQRVITTKRAVFIHRALSSRCVSTSSGISRFQSRPNRDNRVKLLIKFDWNRPMDLWPLIFQIIFRKKLSTRFVYLSNYSILHLFQWILYYRINADGVLGDGALKIYFMYLYLSCTIIIKLSSKLEVCTHVFFTV